MINSAPPTGFYRRPKALDSRLRLRGRFHFPLPAHSADHKTARYFEPDEPTP